MRIQHNIAAMNSYRNYTANTKAVSKNLEKLSSGYRINRAGDDAAGLAISEKMRAQITGLKTAQKNAKDGISLVQTAEGALTEVHSMLNRMVELADQSANGTYDNNVDRANLQKEVAALKTEVNRIADASNFNGIKLLDGSMSKAAGLVNSITSTEVGAKTTSNLGTVGGTAVDGELTAGTAAVDYSAKFYVGDITNKNTADKNLILTYKDNAGVDKTVTIAVKKDGGSITTADVVSALNAGTASSGMETVTDNGVAFDGSTKTGKFSDLYTASANGNVITITAKADGSGTGEKIDGSKLEVSGFTNTFDAADVKITNDKLTEDYAGDGTAAAITFGSAAGTATLYAAKKEGSYQVASTTLALTGTGKDMHNQGITVGDVTYIIKSGTAALKGVPDEGTNVKYVTVKDDDDATAVGTALAAAITKDEKGHGYVATNAAGTLTISESTATGNKILTANDPTKATKASKIATNVQFTLSAGTTTFSGDLTIDSSKLLNGTTVKVGKEAYMLTSDDKMPLANGATKTVKFAVGASSEDIAAALADAITKDGNTGVTANGAKVTFTDATLNDKSGVSAKGPGLTLQIGETPESFNQLSVSVDDMHAAALGIGNVDISTQKGATDAIEKIKSAINSVSSTRGDLGATQNRLEHTINNLSVMTENIQDAESSIRDVDVAEEMMAYTKNNILVQSAQAMLAQANQMPQGVLQLLQ